MGRPTPTVVVRLGRPRQVPARAATRPALDARPVGRPGLNIPPVVLVVVAVGAKNVAVVQIEDGLEVAVGRAA